jgi:hypothetical protein
MAFRSATRSRSTSAPITQAYEAIPRSDDDLRGLPVHRCSDLPGTLASMQDPKIWSAEELERLSPAERTEIIRSGIVTDLTTVPSAFLDRVRANVEDHITMSETTTTPER